MDETVRSGRSEQLLTGYTGRMLLTISVGWAFIQAGRVVISPLLPAISADLGLSNTRAGFSLTVLWGIYALLQYPSGRLSDRLSRKTPLVVGLLAVCIGFGVLSNASTYFIFLAGMVVVGLGAGLYSTPARGLVSDLFVARRGQAFGIHMASGDVGGVIAAGLATVVVGIATWRTAFSPIIGVLVVVTLLAHVWSRERYEFARIDFAIGDTGWRLINEPRLRRLLVAYALFAFAWQAATGFLPTFLLVSKDFSPLVANAGFATLFVVGAIVKPVAGKLGDRWSRNVLAPITLAIAAAMLAGVILSTKPIATTAAVACFAAGLMAYPPVMQAYLMDSFPADSMGGDLGAMRTVYITIGALGPTYVGIVADVFDYVTAFSGLVGCLLASSLLILTMERE